MLTEQLLKYAFGNSSPKNIENLSSLGYPTLKIGKCVSCILIGWLIRLMMSLPNSGKGSISRSAAT
jgi:hypothetical protein